MQILMDDKVTDAREQRPRGPQSRPGDLMRRQTSRLITVDNVLQYASDVPSMQQRFPQARPQISRTKSGRPAAPRLAGRVVPPHMPARSTKVSEKLVLLPEAEQMDGDLEEKADYDEDNEAAPERDDEELSRKSGTKKGKSYAERLPKSRRAEKLARVTAYCTAQAYRLTSTAAFLKDHHGARTKLYDDCLYVVYHLPLLPGNGGYRIRSSPVLKSPGGKAVLDEEIERNERRDYNEGYFEEEGEVERFSIRGNEGDSPQQHDRSRSPRRDSNNSARSMSPNRISPDALTFGEMYIFSYGVTVFWNFTANQEKDILADLTFFAPPSPSISKLSATKLSSALIRRPLSSSAKAPSSLLAVNPLPDEDFETEEFHFEYNPDIPRPRMFNDMITLRSGDHMIKLAIAHAIAQSTKLSYFEQRMANQMASAQHIPRRLALTGTLGLRRKDVTRILGSMYRSRVDVNLSSPVLDTPNFFWSAEPTLHPLYDAVRAYLEISPRVKVLNERCRVFLDLAEILSDSYADSKMSNLTWVVIVLICLSILVTCSEVFLRFGLLTASKGAGHKSLINGTEGLMDGGKCICDSAIGGLKFAATHGLGKMSEMEL
ncbi:MAG: hypothetical protein MMC23_009170 [Stictis urceolatum]|nr:hypothetical protein [Stictis urceolata]